MSVKVYAPWSREVVDALDAFQRRGHFHPFTCGIDSDHGPLIPVLNGWVCRESDCRYTQNWAHAFMVSRYPDQDGDCGEITVTTDGSWWQWIRHSWETRGRWVPREPVRTVSEP